MEGVTKMGARGPKSVASLSVPRVVPIGDARPSPPPSLSAEAAAEWEAVVRRLPAEWFPREVHALLGAYCQHAATLKLLTKMVDEFQVDWVSSDEGLERYNRLLAMRERESRAMADKATKLRITNQARYTPQRAGTNSRPGTERSPWSHVS
jgi:hypothetical protein